MGLFKKAPSPHQTALAMVGARPGDRVLVAGRPEPAVVAELARTTGLSGQTLLAVNPASKAAYDAAAADAGVLIEHAETGADPTSLPDAGGHHDVVVLHFDLATLDDQARHGLAVRALSLVRPGGRVVIIEGRRQGGWFSSRIATVPAEVALGLLQRAGGHAVRTLGNAEGISYFEARKTR
jgi:hypothetical protein